ncbi:hypothetical protein N0V93_000396 [Gnomoniopsis smithogilvyi]|uniref:Uncharacterized protein n=1 Tax=Gnomoniopsis smithogilvyi TaxID=1191159 RepID=A0A9W8Z3X8_9PEZI|nr:hypothetical protein N0V93_000396 [Gnomoniopsis smithogilvyi]
MTIPRVLVANRGEIAVRVLSSARELGLYTIALYTAEDEAHLSYAHEGLKLPSASSYTDVSLLVSLCREHHVSLVHPGYGFLSESAEFSEQLAAAGVTFIGPSSEILRQTGDKLSARKLAQVCGVPVLPALEKPVDNLENLRNFAKDVGLPVMIKAVDGGGGRGIRLVQHEKDLESNFRLATNESPSRQVFAEKAALRGFRHVEVQILGDGLGNVRHFWERECSIQRRFQKIIEIAPSTILDRAIISSVIDASVRMATAIKYCSLGTWEFLVSPESSTYYFMEINPRLQVEHTITETIYGIDLVRWQILTTLGKSIFDLDLDGFGSSDAKVPPPTSTAIQMRITAEDTHRNFALSIGRIRQVSLPGGNGVRVDTHLRPGVTISTEFDSLLAKLIVHGPDWETVVAKAGRALQDLVIIGVETNVSLLQHIVQSHAFQAHDFDIQWVEGQLGDILKTSEYYQHHANPAAFRDGTAGGSSLVRSSTPSSDHLIRKGDRYSIKFEGHGQARNFADSVMTVTNVLRNDFPTSLALRLSEANGHGSPGDEGYIVRVSKLSDTKQALDTGQRGRKTTSTDASTLICPMAGQLVEILVDDGDSVSEGDAVIIVRQMKMELEVRAHRSGTIHSLFDQEEGNDISAGSVICNIIPGEREKL